MQSRLKPEDNSTHESQAASALEELYAVARRAMATTASVQLGAVTSHGRFLRRVELQTPTLPPATHTGCYVLGNWGDSGDIILIDPGSPYPQEQARLDRWLAEEANHGRRLAAVALTHHHADHCGGVAHLQAQGVPVWAHESTARLISAKFKVQRTIADLEVIVSTSDINVRALWTPGHAAGHLCFVFEESNVTHVIAGDMVAGTGSILIDPEEGSMTEYLDSLRRLAQLGKSVLHPSHGPLIPDGEAKLAGYIQHRMMREGKVLDALNASAIPQSLDVLVPSAYADTPAQLWPLAKRSLLAHLHKLRAEQKAASDADGRWMRQ